MENAVSSDFVLARIFLWCCQFESVNISLAHNWLLLQATQYGSVLPLYVFPLSRSFLMQNSSGSSVKREHV